MKTFIFVTLLSVPAMALIGYRFSRSDLESIQEATVSTRYFYWRSEGLDSDSAIAAAIADAEEVTAAAKKWQSP